MHLWNLDPEYLECDGNPKRLRFDGDEPSFTGLVKRCAGDIPPGAVRDELLQSGAIAEDEAGTLRVLKKFYIPDDVDEKALSTLSLILFPIVSGLDHNLRKDRAPQGFIQRFAYSEVLDSEALVEFRSWARSKAAEFVEQVDVWLAAHEHRTRTPSKNQSAPFEVQAGLGVFYYEGPTIGDVITSSKDVSD
jgi:hypothetical protein